MKNIIWETSNTDKICQGSWLYIKKRVATLNELSVEIDTVVNLALSLNLIPPEDAMNCRDVLGIHTIDTQW